MREAKLLQVFHQIDGLHVRVVLAHQRRPSAELLEKLQCEQLGVGVHCVQVDAGFVEELGVASPRIVALLVDWLR